MRSLPAYRGQHGDTEVMRLICTFYHVHGVWWHTVASVAYSPHWVAVSKHTVKCLHEGFVEAHDTWVTCMETAEVSFVSLLNNTLENVRNVHFDHIWPPQKTACSIQRYERLVVR